MDNEQHQKEETIESLRAEVQRLRLALQQATRQPGPRPIGFRIASLKRSFVIALIIGSLVAAAWLSLSPKARNALLRRLVSEDRIALASSITRRDVAIAQPVELSTIVKRSEPVRPQPAEPAPPPQIARNEPVRRLPSSATPKASRQTTSVEVSKPSQPEGPAPHLVREATEPAQSTPRPPKVSQASGGDAYNLVLSSRPKMKQLVSQGPARWNVVKEDNGVIWVDIVIARDGEQHYIWAVDLQKRTVEALSQAARNLEG
ncbi:MAG TPA: hypothetical protein VGQ81_01200 [Acidobacteriota bacterium]|jgi:hypothetical protein|nr:hypothetical protein [Acidobacteriota bacterium]